MKNSLRRVVNCCLPALTAATVLANGPTETLTGRLSTPDTTIRVKALKDRLILSALSDASGKRSWSIAGGAATKLAPTAISDGRTVALRWRLTAKQESPAKRSVSFKFACSPLNIVAHSEWRAAKARGPIEHILSITNKSRKAVILPRQSSLVWSFDRRGRSLESWWVEKGAGRPSAKGVHKSEIGDDFHQQLISGPYVSDERAYSEDGRDRDPIPWVTVFDRNAKAGWYAGVEFSGRSSLELSSSGKAKVAVEIGLPAEPPGSPPFRTVLQPGETYILPTVFVGCYRGSVEDGCNQLKHWVDAELRPKTADPNYPLLTLNSWGSGMAVDAALASSMMRDAARLGLEMYHIDAGWFRAVGDWRPNPSKFPNGIAPVADEAHSLGLKFGLWVGWTQGGVDSDAEDRDAVLNVHAPDRASWFAKAYARDWKPADFVGADLCLADTGASGWCLDLLTRLVKENHLDMLEHDQRMIVQECVSKTHAHTECPGDIAYRAALGYYAVYDALRRRYPNLMFEDCVNGGRMVDFGAARRVHYFSITDSYFPLANRRAFYDTSFVMPPSMCECYVMSIPLKNIGEFRNMIRSGLMGWCTVMQDPAKWTPEQAAAAKQEFETYKQRLRPLIRSGDLYHVSERPDGIRWDGIQYVSVDKSDGVLYAFRGSTHEPEHAYVLQGLQPLGHYRLHFQDGGQADQIVRGSELMTQGVKVKLALPDTSQLVFISAQ